MSSDPLAHRAVAIRAVLLVLTWIGLTGLLIGAGELVTHSATIAHFDRHITFSVVAHRTPPLDATMKAVTWLGSWVAVAVTGGIFLVLVAIRRLPSVVLVLAAVAWVGEFAAVNIVKNVVDRQRPPENLWLVNAHGGSFPSGHAANGTLVFTSLAVVLYLLARARATRVTGWLAACLGIVTVGSSRVELGVHWTTDVIASVIVVAGWLAAIGYLFFSRLPPISPDSSLSDDCLGRADRDKPLAEPRTGPTRPGSRGLIKATSFLLIGMPDVR